MMRLFARALFLILLTSGCGDSGKSSNSTGIGRIEDPDALFAEGRAYVLEGSLQEAIKTFTNLIQAQQAGPEVYQERALAYLGLGNLPRAREDFAQVTLLDPKAAKARYYLGVIFEREGNAEVAIGEYGKAIQLKKDYVEAYVNRSAANYKLKRLNEAIQDISIAIKLNPYKGSLFVNRGVYFNELGKTDLAIQDWSQSIKVDPQFPGAYFSRGVEHGKSGNFKGALQDFTKVLELDPNHLPALQYRAKTFAQLEQHEKAIQDIDRVIQLKPNFAPAYQARAFSLRKLGKPEEAHQWFQKFREIQAKARR